MPETLGRTTVADVVVRKIAHRAAREVPGVHALGGGATRAVAALRDRVPGSSTSVGDGVRAEIGEKQAALDLELVAEHGTPIAEVAASVREHVIRAVEAATGLEVVEVNVAVTDLWVD